MKTTDMIVKVNRAIGQGICMEAADAMVVSGSAWMYHQGNRVK